MKNRMCLSITIALLQLGWAGCEKPADEPATAPVASKPAPAARTKPNDDDGGAVVTDPETIKRIKDLKAIQKSVPIPDAILNTPAAAEFTRHAAPLFKDYGEEKFAIVQVLNIDRQDSMTVPKLIQGVKQLQLAGSVPAWQDEGRTKMNVFMAIAPVTDLDAIAKALADAGVGTNEKADAVKRTITLIAVKAPSQP